MAVSPTNICPDIPLSEEFYSEEKLACSLPPEPILSATRAVDYIYKGSLVCNELGIHLSTASENRKIILLDFETPEQMDRALNRIHFFVERNDKKKVPDLKETQDLHGDGHDYKFSDVVNFYNFCLEKKVLLSSEEQILLGALLNKGLLILDNQSQKYVSTTVQELALIAVRPDQENRDITFEHEFSHGLYFVDSHFRGIVSNKWRSLDPSTQRFLRGAFIASGYYQSRKQELMETEAQAHAIAPPFGSDGFINIILESEKNCSQPQQYKSQACKDFWSYRGNLESLFTFLHTTYSSATSSYIPLLNSKSLPRELYAKLGNIKFVINLGSQPETTEEHVKGELGRIQIQFDRRHKRK